MSTTEKTTRSSPISDRRVGFAGKLGGVNRKEARRLVRDYGGVMVDPIDATVDLIVLGADELPIGDFEDQINAEILEAVSEGRMTVMSETELWQQLGCVDEESDAKRLYTPAMLAHLLDVSITTVRRWHRRGLITPSRQVHKLPYFDFQEVSSARRIAKLVSAGASPDAIESKLMSLASLYPNIDRPLSQLSVIVEGKNLLLQSGGGLLEPGGQKLIDFEPTPANPGNDPQLELLSFESFESERQSIELLNTPDEFLELAIQCEDDDDLDSAAEVYRALCLAFGPSPDACFRLAELLYQQNDLTGARERYFMAVEIDESFVEARASLGCVLVELGQLELAHSVFSGALQHHEDYPDVQYHMARLLDEMQDPDAADLHWKRFLELAPKSPWANEARERLGIKRNDGK